MANVSIEKPIGSPPDVPVQGHIRIRAKTQVRGRRTCVCSRRGQEKKKEGEGIARVGEGGEKVERHHSERYSMRALLQHCTTASS